MSKQWTPAQQSAISDEGGALLVSAAAGSGKTAVLVERAVRLVTRTKDAISADKLLIVTFTNAAADELRSRIAVRIEEEVRARPDDTALRRQRLLLRKANICTIDAFCLQLARENFARLQLPPDISVGDASLLASISEAALASVMEESYQDPAFADFATLYGRARSDVPTQQAILDLYAFSLVLPAPKKALERFADGYKSTTPFLETAWAKELFAYANNALLAVLGQFSSAWQVAEEFGLEKYLPALAEQQSGVTDVLCAVQSADWDGALYALEHFPNSKFAPVRGQDEAKDRVKALRDSAKKILANLGKYCFVCTVETFEEERAESAPLVQALCDATQLYSTRYYEAKLAEKVLDFSDFEQLALGLLQTEDGERTAMADIISRRFDVVMVDEYQDTNELQAALYESLAHPSGDNLFYVGDAKQSIYRFRMANPQLFTRKKNTWQPLHTNLHPAVVTLGHNFRSGAGVVGGVNFVFSLLMSPELGEILYNESEELIQGIPGGNKDGFEVHIVQDEEEVGDATYVANLISTMVKDGYEVGDGEGVRPCSYGDFCILLRAKKPMPLYLAALEAQAIPAACTAQDNLLQTPEILPLLAMLGVIDNPANDINVAAALLGPIYGWSGSEITLLRSEQSGTSLWGALLQSDMPKAVHFVESVALYRTLAQEMPAGRLCEEFASRTSYFSAVAAMDGGSARQDNVERFLQWANSFSTSGRGTLSSFIRLVENGSGPSDSAGKVVPGHVNIMSIHKSKGLEFPVCILANSERKFYMGELNERVQMHSEMGLGLTLRHGDTLLPTLPQRAIRSRIERETLSEEMRIFYVALTRAKDKIIVTAAHKNPAAWLDTKADKLRSGLPSAFLLSQEHSFAQWAVTAALCHADVQKAQVCSGIAVLPQHPAKGTMQLLIVSQSPTLDSISSEFNLSNQLADMEQAEQLAKSFGTQSPRAPLQSVPVKMSVSELAKPDMPAVYTRPSFMYQSGLTAAEKGTAQHLFMQFANFTSAKSNLASELERLVQLGFIPIALAQKLDMEGIATFLASALAQRMASANGLLRECDFISSVPACTVQQNLPEALAQESVLVQGVADAVLLFDDHTELVDYKTDRGKTSAQLVQLYQKQLHLYQSALQKRFAQPIAKLTLWAFTLGEEIDVPLP